MPSLTPMQSSPLSSLSCGFPATLYLHPWRSTRNVASWTTNYEEFYLIKSFILFLFLSFLLSSAVEGNFFLNFPYVCTPQLLFFSIYGSFFPSFFGDFFFVFSSVSFLPYRNNEIFGNNGNGINRKRFLFVFCGLSLAA